MFDQQLIEALSGLLEQKPGGFSEFELIQVLQQPPYEYFDKEALKSDLAMFRCHFILFHCLYQLQDKWIQTKTCFLDIHVTCIRRLDWQEGFMTEGDDKLRKYYLDWHNLSATSEQDVVELLNSFWQQMGKLDQVTAKDKKDALLVLGMEEPLSAENVKLTYRKLMHQHHPDKGGDLAFAQRVDWAYRTLKALV